jgi:hypothetical protein
VISIALLFQTDPIRKFRYPDYPSPLLDELNYVWQAKSLKKYGVPVAWTLNLGVYQNSKFNPRFCDLQGFVMTPDGQAFDRVAIKKDARPCIATEQIDYAKGLEYVSFVAPFFDHPPLGGLIFSLGADDKIQELQQVKTEDIRKPAIILAVITAVLLFIFLSLLTTNPWIGLLALIIYTTVPTYVLGTRIAILENAVSPLILIHLIFLYLFVHATKNIKPIFSYGLLCISGIFGGLSVLAKEPALGFLVGSLVLLVLNKIPLRRILAFLIATSLPVFLYVFWGMSLNPGLFLGIFSANTNREYFGAIKLVTMLEALKFKNFPTDGWWIFGLLSFVLISIKLKDKKYLFLLIPLITHLLFVLLVGSANYPWYLLSCIPFFAGCSAIFIWQLYKDPSFVTGLLFFLIPFSSSYYWGRYALGVGQDVGHYRSSFLIFLTLLFISIRFKKSRIVQVVWFIFLAVLIRKVIIFNIVFFPQLIAHWGSLPVPSLPYF